MISRELFTMAIDSLRKVSDDNLKVNNVLREIGSDSYYIPNSCEDVVVKLLEDATGDDDYTISWWCYETDFGRNENMNKMWDADDNEIPMNTVDDLYDYLIEDQEG